MGMHKFVAILNAAQREVLRGVLAHARTDPGDTPRWRLDGTAIGVLRDDHARVLAALWPPLWPAPCWQGPDLDWDTRGLDPAQRSVVLADVAQRLRAAGHLSGWRNELYATWSPALQDSPADPDPAWPELFRLERGTYRYFGLRSHAVHINGFTPDGRMWCGRRALSKATDPGRLDNLAAGGLPAGETIADCMVRELWEEAGVPAALALRAEHAGRITTARAEPQGWHDETLFICNLELPEGFTPRNTDGEVSGFECLAADAVIERIVARDFSDDAACVVATGVLQLLNR